MARKPDFLIDLGHLDGPAFCFKMDKGDGWTVSKPRKDNKGETRWYNIGAMFKTGGGKSESSDSDWD